MKPLYLFYFCSLILSWITPPAYALQKLSDEQMKNTVAQAGISIALKDVKIESYKASFKLTNPDKPLQYISFEQGHSTLRLSNSSTDLDGDGLIGFITIDLLTVTSGQPFIYIESKDMELDYDLTIDTVNFSGNDIGSIAIDNLAMPSFHLYLGAHGSGIDAEFGAQTSIDRLSYGTDATDTLTFSGITFASTFSGDISAPSTWKPTGELTAGDIDAGNPVTIDIASDNTEFWEKTDKDGTAYKISNPRAGSGFIALNMPINGSVRIENMNFGDTNMGSLVMDNMDIKKLYIEIPGRGLGVLQP